MPRSKMELTRRTFLRSSVAAGAALSLPWLPGCGEGSDGASSPSTPGEGTQARHRANLHFDLSSFDPNETYVLHAIGSSANKIRLKPHNRSTRAAAKKGSRRLGAVADARLTHYASSIDLPARAVQHVWVTAGTGARALPVLSKIFCGGFDPNDPDVLVTSRDKAVALIFHHHELIRLDPDQAQIICAHIEASFLDGLEELLGDPDSIVEVPLTDFDGNPLLDSKGVQMVQFEPTDEVLVEAELVCNEVKQRVFDDPELENTVWHSAEGQTSVEVAPPPPQAGAGQPAEFFDAEWRPDSHNKSSAHGVYFTGLELEHRDRRTIKLEFKNFWLRWVAVYVDFYGWDGHGVKWTEPPILDLNYDLWNNRDADGQVLRSRFLTILGANNDYLGIPVLPVDTAATPVRFDMPPGAQLARISFLTFGRGSSDYWSIPHDSFHANDPYDGLINPSAMTLLFNIGIPAVLLAAAVGTDPLVVLGLKEIASDEKLWLDLARLVPASIFKSVKTNDWRPFVLAFSSKLVSLAVKSLPTLAAWFAATLEREELEQAVPFVGWSMKVASISAASAKLGQTLGEVQSSPEVFQNHISLMITTRVTIHHDPADPAGFPATATKWEAQASYDGMTGRRFSGELPAAQTAPIVLEFTNASGGTGVIDVWFLTDNNWIAGHGSTGKFANLPAVGGVPIEQTITIRENLVPIDETTTYHHRQKLAIESGGRYVWQQAKDAPPTQTATSLLCTTDSLCDLSGITVSEDSASVGYAWMGRSRTAQICGSGTTTAAVHRMQSVAFTAIPDDGLKRAACAYRSKPVLAYELRAAAGQAGRHFYLDPSGYHLRAVTLERAPFDQTSRLSWGQFSQQQDSLAIHPSGWVVGINTEFHKLELLRLPAAPSPDDEAATPSIKAGLGTRDGLLDTPIAVGVVLLTGAIYVLEGGNARIQAFDVRGNPTLVFNDGTSATMPLTRESNATYLDMAVESTGLIYVLSFAGNGRTAADYRLDVYDPSKAKEHVSRTTGVAAGKLAVDVWRNIFTLNYEPIVGPDGIEPSLSEWIPSTPDGCTQANNPFCNRF